MSDFIEVWRIKVSYRHEITMPEKSVEVERPLAFHWHGHVEARLERGREHRVRIDSESKIRKSAAIRFALTWRELEI
jgi:hypothetical protein